MKRIVILLLIAAMTAGNGQAGDSRQIVQENNVQNLFQESIVHIQNKRYDQALQYIQKAKSIDSENAEIYRMEGLLLEMLGRKKDAATAWDNCLKYAELTPLKEEANIHIKSLKD